MLQQSPPQSHGMAAIPKTLPYHSNHQVVKSSYLTTHFLDTELRTEIADAKSTPSYSSDLHFLVLQNGPDNMFKKVLN